MKFIHSSVFLIAIGFIAAQPARAVTLGFESGFTDGQTTFTTGNSTFSLNATLRITRFNTFGSGGGDWFVDTGFGQSRSGSVGGFATTSPTEGFQLSSMDLWTSNDGGNNFAPGDVTFTGITETNTTVTQTITVNPTSNSGAGWDTTNSLANFSGLTLKSFAFSVGSGINYLAIDNLALTVVPIPEPSVLGCAVLSAILVSAAALRRKRQAIRLRDLHRAG